MLLLPESPTGLILMMVPPSARGHTEGFQENTATGLTSESPWG